MKQRAYITAMDCWIVESIHNVGGDLKWMVEMSSFPCHTRAMARYEKARLCKTFPNETFRIGRYTRQFASKGTA